MYAFDPIIEHWPLKAPRRRRQRRVRDAFAFLWPIALARARPDRRIGDAGVTAGISYAQLNASIHGWIKHVHHADSWGLRRQVLETLPIRPGEHRRAIAARWVGPKKCEGGADAQLRRIRGGFSDQRPLMETNTQYESRRRRTG